MNDIPRLDPTTLFLAISMVAFLNSSVAHSARLAVPLHADALVSWRNAMLAAGAAFLLYFLRGHAPRLLTYTIANGLAVLVPAYILMAHVRLFRKSYPRKLICSALSLSWIAAIAVPLIQFPPYLGIAVFCATGAIMLGMTAHLLASEFLRGHSPRMPAAAFTAGISALTGLGFAARAVVSWLGGAEGFASNSGTSTHVGPLLLAALLSVGGSMGFMSMVNSLQSRAMLELSQRDGLTGVLTRTAFFDLVAEAKVQQYAVVMLDIDHFKAVNDTYGHRGGDLTLAHAARHIAGSVRISDMVGRYGGEEFCLFLPDCSEAHARALSERIVLEARQQSVRLPDGRAIRYTLSAGFAVHLPSDAGINATLDRADQALYRAKRDGRDRALSAEGQRPLPGAAQAPA